MRGALLVSLLVVLLVPGCWAAPPIVPDITVTIAPQSMNVTSPPGQNTTVQFNGTVTVDKLPIVRIVVTLTPTVDAGWPASCSPDTIVVTDSGPHSYVCSVVIPEAVPNTTANLEVDAMGVGGGFQVTASVQAVIIVHGTASTNKTGGAGKTGTNQTNGGGNGTSQGGQSKQGSLDMTGLAILGVAIAASGGGAGAYWVHWKRKARRQLADGAEDVSEVAEET